MDFIKKMRQELWPRDLENYNRWKDFARQYPSEKNDTMVAKRREEMVRKYGESAMKDI